MAQQLVERKGFQNHELGRTGRMALYGGAVFGPAATTWFGFLQRRIRIPSSPNLEILARVAADQGIFASCNLFVFLSSMAIVEGSDPKKKLETTYWNALTSNWMVWPVVQFANFKFVPLEHRVMVVNVISLGKSHTRARQTLGDLKLTSPRRLELLPQLPQQPGSTDREPDLPPRRLVHAG